MSVVPAILGDLFGVKHFGRNWGVMMFFNAISASILQVAYLANHIFQSDKPSRAIDVDFCQFFFDFHVCLYLCNFEGHYCK